MFFRFITTYGKISSSTDYPNLSEARQALSKEADKFRHNRNARVILDDLDNFKTVVFNGQNSETCFFSIERI